jgi:hypothetical protein
MRNTVSLSQVRGIMSLSRCRRSCNENLQREKSSVKVKLLIQERHSCFIYALFIMPEGCISENIRALKLQIKSYIFRPFFIYYFIQLHIFNLATSHSCWNSFHYLFLGLSFSTINCYKILLSQISTLNNKLNWSGKIHHMNGRNSISTLPNNWKSSKFLMQWKPSSSKELIKHIISFSVSIKKSTTYYMNSQIWSRSSTYQSFLFSLISLQRESQVF